MQTFRNKLCGMCKDIQPKIGSFNWNVKYYLIKYLIISISIDSQELNINAHHRFVKWMENDTIASKLSMQLCVGVLVITLRNKKTFKPCNSLCMTLLSVSWNILFWPHISYKTNICGFNRGWVRSNIAQKVSKDLNSSLNIDKWPLPHQSVLHFTIN